MNNLVIHGAPYKSDPLFGCKINMESKPFLERLKCFTIPIVKFIWQSRSSISHLNEIRTKLGIEPTNYPFERARKSLTFTDSFFGFEIPFELSPITQVNFFFKKKFLF